MAGNVLAFFGVLFVFASSINIILNGETYNIPMFVRVLSGIVAVAFLILLIYSVLIEVNKKRSEKEKLLTTGTYALSRHPGVIWFLFYYIFGSVLFANTEILVAGIIWSITNIIYVLLQEKLVFNKLFENYDKYRKTTPMLFPTIKSIKRFMTTKSGGRNERFTSDV
jgi:protein-S-isoprenylcysteine O-methyltransferase Ste14